MAKNIPLPVQFHMNSKSEWAPKAELKRVRLTVSKSECQVKPKIVLRRLDNGVQEYNEIPLECNIEISGEYWIISNINFWNDNLSHMQKLPKNNQYQQIHVTYQVVNATKGHILHAFTVQSKNQHLLKRKIETIYSREVSNDALEHGTVADDQHYVDIYCRKCFTTAKRARYNDSSVIEQTRIPNPIKPIINAVDIHVYNSSSEAVWSNRVSNANVILCNKTSPPLKKQVNSQSCEWKLVCMYCKENLGWLYERCKLHEEALHRRGYKFRIPAVVLCWENGRERNCIGTPKPEEQQSAEVLVNLSNSRCENEGLLKTFLDRTAFTFNWQSDIERQSLINKAVYDPKVKELYGEWLDVKEDVGSSKHSEFVSTFHTYLKELFIEQRKELMKEILQRDSVYNEQILESNVLHGAVDNPAILSVYAKCLQQQSANRNKTRLRDLVFEMAKDVRISNNVNSFLQPEDISNFIKLDPL